MPTSIVNDIVARPAQSFNLPRDDHSYHNQKQLAHPIHRIDIAAWLFQVVIVLYATNRLDEIINKLSEGLTGRTYRIRSDQVLATALARALHSTYGGNCRPTNQTIAQTIKSFSPLWVTYLGGRELATSIRTIRLCNRILEHLGAIELVSPGHGSSSFIGQTSQRTGKAINAAAVYKLTYPDPTYTKLPSIPTVKVKTILGNLTCLLHHYDLPKLLTTNTTQSSCFPLMRIEFLVRDLKRLRILIKQKLPGCVLTIPQVQRRRRNFFIQRAKEKKITTKLLTAPLTDQNRHHFIHLANKISTWSASGKLTPLHVLNILLDTPQIGPAQTRRYLLNKKTTLQTIELLAEQLTTNWKTVHINKIPTNPTWWKTRHLEYLYLQRLLTNIALRIPSNDYLHQLHLN